MIIEQSSVPIVIEPKRQNYFWPLILGTIITLTATTLPILFVIAKSDRPTGTLLSPIPEGVITDSRSTPEQLSSQEAVLLSQNYLNKAYDLLRNPSQTEEDRAAIRVSLNNSLRQIESALKLEPERQEAHQLRSQILAEIKKLIPNPTSQNVTIASAGEDSSSSGQTNSVSNANQNRFILPAGQSELTTKDTQVKTDSYIYLLPVENSSVVVSLLSKSSGSFTISADTPPETDLPISYYIINE